MTKQDNQSTIGALSWLASQTRPDLQSGVSLAQRKQKNPTYANVKETNKVVKIAQNGKKQRLEYKPVASSFAGYPGLPRRGLGKCKSGG